MITQLLTSEDYIKSHLPIPDTLEGKYLQPAIREAQEFRLEAVLGTALLEKLQSLIIAGTIGDAANADYKLLLDKHCQPVLAYEAVANVIPTVSFKVTNAGLVQTSDENVQPQGIDNVARMQQRYTDKADELTRRMQSYLRRNRSKYPELNASGQSVKPNLGSAASCGIWLGGEIGEED